MPALNIWLVSVCLALPAVCASGQNRPRADLDLRLLTWNVQRDNLQHLGIVAQLQAADADIVCLQEVTPALASLLEERLIERYPHQESGACMTSQAGGTVLSRYPIRGRERLAHPGTGRPACRVALLTPLGRVQVLNLHLTYPQVASGSVMDRAKSYLQTASLRRAEVVRFCQALTPDVPALVAGDFNSLEDEGSVQYLKDKMGLLDAYRRLHPSRGDADWTWSLHGDPAASMKARIDYIFASPDFTPMTARILPCTLSDHRPVIVQLRLSIVEGK